MTLEEAPRTWRPSFRGRRRAAGGVWFRQESSAGPSIVYAGSARRRQPSLFGVTAFVFDAEGKFREKVTAPSARLRAETDGS